MRARPSTTLLNLKGTDIETGLDYFLARYYSSTQGRFTGPDEFSGGPDELFDFTESAAENPTFYAELDNPQSLNKYQYTYNPIELLPRLKRDRVLPGVLFTPAESGVTSDVPRLLEDLRDELSRYE